jgi:hypothetical protein
MTESQIIIPYIAWNSNGDICVKIDELNIIYYNKHIFWLPSI